MSSLSIIIGVALVQGILCAAPPVPYYDSYGLNKLYVDEGRALKTVSGADFLKGVSANRCSEVCHWMDRACDCCNSFTYRPTDETCYLKLRNPGASEALKTSSDNWQSYKYWGLVSAIPGQGYEGGLPMTAFGRSVGSPIGFPYEVAFFSKGPNQIAIQEGTSIQTSQGQDKLTNSSPKQCSEDCNAIPDCDAFSYNPFQNGGTCFMKKNSPQKYDTTYNQDGWTYYWKKSDYDHQECFCTCKTNNVCIMCQSSGCVQI